MADRTAPPARCVWCAPTARALLVVSPCVPRGGAAATGFAPDAPVPPESVPPWQLVQERFATSSTPLMCLPPATSMVPSAFTVAG